MTRYGLAVVGVLVVTLAALVGIVWVTQPLPLAGALYVTATSSVGLSVAAEGVIKRLDRARRRALARAAHAAYGRRPI